MYVPACAISCSRMSTIVKTVLVPCQDIVFYVFGNVVAIAGAAYHMVVESLLPSEIQSIAPGKHRYLSLYASHHNAQGCAPLRQRNAPGERVVAVNMDDGMDMVRHDDRQQDIRVWVMRMDGRQLFPATFPDGRQAHRVVADLTEIMNSPVGAYRYEIITTGEVMVKCCPR